MFKETLRQTWVEIDLSALDHNIKSIREKIGSKCEIIGVVKADAYGHGSVECTRILQQNGVDRFAVATIEEALVLRDAGIEDPIILLGLVPDMCADTVVEYDLSPVISSLDRAEQISKAAVAAGKKADCLIAVDTGMGRIGYTIDRPAEIALAEEEISKIDELPSLRIVGMISHFSSSDEEDKEYTRKQIRLFTDFYERLSSDGYSLPWLTIANSAAIMEYSCSTFDAVRPGIILYGCYPSAAVDKENLDIEPVMSVKANIVYMKTVPAGTSISYGRKFVTERESRIATIALGYADGYSRLLTGKAEAIVRGRRAPVVGSICMDQCMIDVTDIPGAQRCDEVVIMGAMGDERISAEELAEKEGTINYEILCGFGMRLPKVYVNRPEK